MIKRNFVIHYNNSPKDSITWWRLQVGSGDCENDHFLREALASCSPESICDGRHHRVPPTISQYHLSKRTRSMQLRLDVAGRQLPSCCLCQKYGGTHSKHRNKSFWITCW